MNVYFLSGLGADERAFQKLVLPAKWNVIHVKWPEIGHGETLMSYAYKIAALVDQSQPFSLVGLSFGGIMATELAKFLKPKAVIIISSIATHYSMPPLFRWAGRLGLNSITPQAFLNKVYPFTYWYFGMKTEEEKTLLKAIIHDTPPAFLKWAIREILHWKNEQKHPSIYHIHGDSDKIFPIGCLKADVVIPNGGHFMVYTHPEVISDLIINHLEKNAGKG